MAPRKLHLETGADLFDALRSPSVGLRMAMLHAIARHPEKARALAQGPRWDLLDELVHQASNRCSVPYYRLLVKALAPYRDPRVETLFGKVSAMARDSEILEVVNGALQRWAQERVEVDGQGDEAPKVPSAEVGPGTPDPH